MTARKSLVFGLMALAAVALTGLASSCVIDAIRYGEFDRRSLAIEAKVARFVPSGTTIEKYVESLPDDGAVWRVIGEVGSRLYEFSERLGDQHQRALREARSQGRPDEVAVDPTREFLHEGAYSLAFPWYELEAHNLDTVVSDLEPILEPLMRLKTDRASFMISTDPTQFRISTLPSSINVIEVVRLFKTVNAFTVAKAKMGHTKVAEAWLTKSFELIYSLVPTAVLGHAVASLGRSEVNVIVVALHQQGLLSEATKRRILEVKQTFPLRIDHIPAGEVIQFYQGDFPDGRRLPYSERFRALTMDRGAFPTRDHWYDGITTLDCLANSLDPTSPQGRFYLAGPLDVTVRDVLDTCKESLSFGRPVGLTATHTAVLTSVLQSALLSTKLDLALRSPEELLAMRTRDASGPDADSKPHADLESLSMAGLRVAYDVGSEIVLVGDEGQETRLSWPWRIAHFPLHAPLAHLVVPELTVGVSVPIPASWLKARSILLVAADADATPASHGIRVTSIRRLGSNDPHYPDPSGSFHSVLRAQFSDLADDAIVIATIDVASEHSQLCAIYFSPSP